MIIVTSSSRGQRLDDGVPRAEHLLEGEEGARLAQRETLEEVDHWTKYWWINKHCQDMC